ncbi:hypothetical protein HPB52_023707 [Rhipicephalus sanguineus]|uniref:Nuclease HARBI1 n=1 Tax=Rhipicephalus sanguineus TaxID=34632 RepID=A0A9D4YR63_RHISA|nr:hypothetical protein HPB52_023707 [Rhipicephalus sanguineus]
MSMSAVLSPLVSPGVAPRSLFFRTFTSSLFGDVEVCVGIPQPLFRDRPNPMEHFTESEFPARFRFTKNSVKKLLECLPLEESCSNRGHPLPPMMQLLIALRFYGPGTLQAVAADLVNVSQPTVSSVIEGVSWLISTHLFPDVVKFTSSDDRFRETMVGFHGIAKFPGVTGCIDCSHIRTKAPGGQDGEVYHNRKGYISINVHIRSPASDVSGRVSSALRRYRLLGRRLAVKPSPQLLLRSLLVCTLSPFCSDCYLGRCFLSSSAALPPGLPPAAIAASITHVQLFRPCFQMTYHYPRIWAYVHAPDNLAASVVPPTSTRNSAVVVMPSKVLLLPGTNPFAPLRELEEQNNIEGKFDSASHQARIISAAPNGEKRARGSLLPTPERGTKMAVGYQSPIDAKQQNRATVAPTPSSGSPRKYQHTVILRPKQPCRIMDEEFIQLDRVITRHISAHLDLSEEDPLPEFTVRYLGHSNQLAVDAAEHEVRNALLAIASLPVSGKNVPFHAYEAVKPKCRNCGGPHLATAANCPKRPEVNQKIERKRKPAAKRQRKKRLAQGHQRRNPETEQGSPRTILKPTRQSFYTGPPAPPAAQSEVSRRITFAEIVTQASAHLTNAWLRCAGEASSKGFNSVNEASTSQ